jgi:hypothetical protein
LALPWTALDKVTFRFTQDVEMRREEGPRGVGPGVPVNDINSEPVARAATWTLERPVGADRLTLTLDGAAFAERHPYAAGPRGRRYFAAALRMPLFLM